MARRSWFSPGALLLVVVGGALGVAMRAVLVVPLTAGGAAPHPLLLPAVTLGINLLGSLLLGVIVGWLDDRHPLGRLFLGSGVMGGFTTYSAFAVQSVTTTSALPFVGLALMAVSVAGGVLAAAAGLDGGRRIAGLPGRQDGVEAPEDAE